MAIWAQIEGARGMHYQRVKAKNIEITVQEFSL